MARPGTAAGAAVWLLVAVASLGATALTWWFAAREIPGGPADRARGVPKRLDELSFGCCRRGAALGQPKNISEIELSSGPCQPTPVCIDGKNRLGNNLKALNRALWIAKQRNFCYVLFYVIKNDVKRLLDVPWNGVFRLNQEEQPLYETNAKLKKQCWDHCRTFECKIPGVKYPNPRILRRLQLHYVEPYLRCNRSQPPVPERTLVIHLRGGDTLYGSGGGLRNSKIFLPGHYPMPPCAYWTSVMRYGNSGRAYEDVLVLMEPGWPHPCLDIITNASSAVRVQSGDLAEDACTIVAAQHLAIGFGTFGVELARLNTNLLALHVPFGDDGLNMWEYQTWELIRGTGMWFRYDMVSEAGMPYVQHVYSFPGFVSNQTYLLNKRQALVDYDARDVVKRTIPCACGQPED